MFPVRYLKRYFAQVALTLKYASKFSVTSKFVHADTVVKFDTVKSSMNVCLLAVNDKGG